MKKRVCFVVQRYGLEVNGGAELLCRQLAELMNTLYDIDVVTTKAIDYMSWKNEYGSSKETINGVSVLRFPVEKERVREKFDEINGRFLQGRLPVSEEQRWIDEQGPYTPELIEYIRKYKNEYAVFVFFTYLYYPTVMGIREVQEKAIVLPFAHDEPYLRMQIFRNVFLLPKAFLFETEEERSLVRNRYHNYYIPFKFGGAGVNVPEQVSGETFKKKYGLSSYIIYVGRIDAGKNCEQLFDYFLKYKQLHPGELKLVLLGKAVIPVPKNSDIVELGFVSEEDKFNGISGAELLALPSKFESLSIVVLEAFSLEVPVLVNGMCEVLKGHCQRSGGGFYYDSFSTFEDKMNRLLGNEQLKAEMGQKGKKYVKENFQWDLIKRKFSSLIEYVIEENNRRRV